MSEAELHVIKQRMLAGKRAKAERGELGMPLPMGYTRRLSGEVIKDPDEQAQATIELVFEQFERALATRYLETRLQCEHLAHRDRKSLRDRDALLLRTNQLIGREAQRLRLSHVFLFPVLGGYTDAWLPEENAQEEHRRD